MEAPFFALMVAQQKDVISSCLGEWIPSLIVSEVDSNSWPSHTTASVRRSGLDVK